MGTICRTKNNACTNFSIAVIHSIDSKVYSTSKFRNSDFTARSVTFEFRLEKDRRHHWLLFTFKRRESRSRRNVCRFRNRPHARAGSRGAETNGPKSSDRNEMRRCSSGISSREFSGRRDGGAIPSAPPPVAVAIIIEKRCVRPDRFAHAVFWPNLFPLTWLRENQKKKKPTPHNDSTSGSP